MKLVCNGCVLAALKRGMRDCPFCRTPRPKKSQGLTMIRKRVDAGDPVAIFNLGNLYEYGLYGFEKDATRAVELYERAAKLEVKKAHFNLGAMYAKGTDVEKDTAKALRHYDAAAICGRGYKQRNKQVSDVTETALFLVGWRGWLASTLLLRVWLQVARRFTQHL